MTQATHPDIAAVLGRRAAHAVVCGDGVEALEPMRGADIDLVFSDLPYAEIDRHYGRMTERAWGLFARRLARAAVAALGPRGSAVFVLQPNSERIGRMRPWFFQFLAWCAARLPRETGGRIGMVQDVWWWNIAAAPTVHCRRENGLLRPSLKACVWVGPEDCFRAQQDVLWGESLRNAEARATARATGLREQRPSGQSWDVLKSVSAAEERGGVTPFNVLPMPNTNSTSSAGSLDHGAGTPLELALWWVRYLCPTGGLVVDPCGGTMTTGEAASGLGKRFVGIEIVPGEYEKGRARMNECAGVTVPARKRADDAGDGPLFVTRRSDE